MEVILLQNMIFSGRRYRAGETMVMGEELAKKLLESALVAPVPRIEDGAVVVEPEAEEPVKKPIRRTTKKVAKG